MPERKPCILVVDDRPEMAETLADGLSDHGYEAVAVPSSREALAMIEGRQELPGLARIDALVTDLRMPAVDGLELLTASRKAAPERPVIVMTAFGAIDSAVECIRRGAYHYLTKPFKLDELLLFLARALGESELRRESATLRAALREKFGFGNLLGKSAAMRRAIDIAERVAPTAARVLLLGETGTGKGLFAHAIHGASPRAGRAFVAVNCAALPEALLESELFGHVKGAFTGATGERAGLFTQADGGTLFLDEIGEMTPALQAKLLRAIETGKVRPVGASKEHDVDVRLIAATHRDLRDRVRDGSFREDLLYRLEVVSIELLPLRQRKEDLPELIAHFLFEAKSRHPASPVKRIAPDALARLLDHSWPGNLRELAHALERVVLLGRSEEAAEVDLPGSMEPPAPSIYGPPLGEEILPIREVQRRYAIWALEKCGGHRTGAAEKLGVDGKTLARWVSGLADPPGKR